MFLSDEEKGQGTPTADDVDEVLCGACGFSRMERYICFGTCFCLGWLCSWLAFLHLRNPPMFAIMYTMGNLISLSGGFFLSGPCNHLKSLCAPTRAVATGIYFLTMALTLFVAFERMSAGIVFLCAFLQFLAMVWYMASYIPYGRALITKCVGGVVGV